GAVHRPGERAESAVAQAVEAGQVGVADRHLLEGSRLAAEVVRLLRWDHTIDGLGEAPVRGYQVRHHYTPEGTQLRQRKIRNPNVEIRNKLEIRIPKDSNQEVSLFRVCLFGDSDLFRISTFGFRISPSGGRGGEDGADDLVVAGAATQVAGEEVPDLVLGRPG